MTTFACRCFFQTARDATVWSGWKYKHVHPMFSASMEKGPFGSAKVISSNMTSQAEEVPYPLTKEEAVTFLDHSLQISPLQVHAGGRSLDFLNHVIKGIKKTQPFTSINLLAEMFPELGPEGFKHHITSGQGGTCLWINPFTKALLEQLGHTAYHIHGYNPAIAGKESSHISTIVCDISYPGSRHLVDPGTRWPLVEAVPLDFERESPEYTFHNMRIKFFKKENDTLLLCIPSPSAYLETQVVRDSDGENWLIRLVYRYNYQVPWSELPRKWQGFARNGILSDKKPFDSLLFFAFLNDISVSIVCSDGQTHATFYNLEDYTTERLTMTKTEVMDFFVKNYPQYSVKKLEKVFEASKMI